MHFYGFPISPQHSPQIVSWLSHCITTLISSYKTLQHRSWGNWQLIGLAYWRFHKNSDTKTLLQLYKTFIRPHLEYCSIVWDPYLVKDNESAEVWPLDVLEEVGPRSGATAPSFKCCLIAYQESSCKAMSFNIQNHEWNGWLPKCTLDSQGALLQCQISNLKAACSPWQRARTLQFEKSLFSWYNQVVELTPCGGRCCPPHLCLF